MWRLSLLWVLNVEAITAPDALRTPQPNYESLLAQDVPERTSKVYSQHETKNKRYKTT